MAYALKLDERNTDTVLNDIVQANASYWSFDGERFYVMIETSPKGDAGFFDIYATRVHPPSTYKYHLRITDGADLERVKAVFKNIEWKIDLWSCVTRADCIPAAADSTMRKVGSIVGPRREILRQLACGEARIATTEEFLNLTRAFAPANANAKPESKE